MMAKQSPTRYPEDGIPRGTHRTVEERKQAGTSSQPPSTRDLWPEPELTHQVLRDLGRLDRQAWGPIGTRYSGKSKTTPELLTLVSRISRVTEPTPDRRGRDHSSGSSSSYGPPPPYPSRNITPMEGITHHGDIEVVKLT